ncbi:unnamed protein product, partial [marine sediment metagenome]
MPGVNQSIGSMFYGITIGVVPAALLGAKVNTILSGTALTIILAGLIV